MKIVRKFLIIAGLLSFFFLKASLAQKENINNYNGWYMYAGDHKFHEKWSLHTVVHISRSNFIPDWQQLLSRAGLNYHISTGVILTADMTMSFLSLWRIIGKRKIIYACFMGTICVKTGDFKNKVYSPVSIGADVDRSLYLQ